MCACPVHPSACGVQLYPWLNGVAYVPVELFRKNGIGSPVLRALDYCATDSGGIGRTCSEVYEVRAAVGVAARTPDSGQKRRRPCPWLRASDRKCWRSQL